MATATARPMLMSVEETARELGVTTRYVFKLIERNELDSIKLGRRRMIVASALTMWIERLIEENREQRSA